MTVHVLNGDSMNGIVSDQPVLSGMNGATEASPLRYTTDNLSAIVTQNAGGTPNLLRFDLGTLFNHDNDANVEQIVIRFNVVVVDDSVVNNINDIIENDALVSSTTDEGDESTRTTRDDDDADITIIEPFLELEKTSETPPAEGWQANDTVDFTVVLSHTT